MFQRFDIKNENIILEYFISAIYRVFISQSINRFLQIDSNDRFLVGT